MSRLRGGSRLLLPGVALLFLGGSATAARAQAVAPPGWRWSFDGGVVQPDTAWVFTRMPPGWHVTMAAGGFLFDPAARAEGRFELESEIFIFPGSPEGEGYGVFAGGTERGGRIDAIAFLLRPDGMAGVFRWAAGEARALVEWTRHEAIVRTSAEGPVKNVVRVIAEADRVHVLVNGDTVGTVPRDAAPVDGAVGLRMGAGVNAHVTTLDVTRRLAPPPPPR